ncbi:MAG TPA: hypothetical protein VG368_00645 [Acidimicrobiales bacterium]|jgi:hypothetical protein|nr:hypothetical protein [Acidimicrobiales bacterium]
MLGAPSLLGLLGISAGSLVNVLLGAVTNWVEAGSAAIVNGVGVAMAESTSVSFGSAFLALYGSIRTIGGAVALPFLLAATIQALVQQDAASLVRTVLVRAPVALLGSGIAIWVVEEGLAVTDAFSTAILSNNGASSRFIGEMVTLLATPGQNVTGFLGVILALVAGFASLVLWVELVIRSSAVLCASLFIPLALVGVIWPVTSHWIRRLGETLGALVLAKVAMCAVLMLGVSSLERPSGASGVIEGTAILLLAALAPFAILRLLPFVELGGISHLGGMSQRTVGAAATRIPNPLGGGSPGGSVKTVRAPIPEMEAQHVDPGAFARNYEAVRNELAARERTGPVAGGGEPR